MTVDNGASFELTLRSLDFPLESRRYPAPPEAVTVRAVIEVRSLVEDRDALFDISNGRWALAGPRNVAEVGVNEARFCVEADDPGPWTAFIPDEDLPTLADQCVFSASSGANSIWRLPPGGRDEVTIFLATHQGSVDLFVEEAVARQDQWSVLYMPTWSFRNQMSPVVLDGADL